MTEEEYRKSTENIVKSIGAAILAVVLTAAGCASLASGGRDQFDSTSADDRQNIAEHARQYWDNRVDPDTGDTLPTEPTEETDRYTEGVVDTVRRFRDACLRRNEFYIQHEGVRERYACLNLRNSGDVDWSRLVEKYSEKPYEFETE